MSELADAIQNKNDNDKNLNTLMKKFVSELIWICLTPQSQMTRSPLTISFRVIYVWLCRDITDFLSARTCQAEQFMFDSAETLIFTQSKMLCRELSNFQTHADRFAPQSKVNILIWAWPYIYRLSLILSILSWLPPITVPFVLPSSDIFTCTSMPLGAHLLSLSMCICSPLLWNTHNPTFTILSSGFDSHFTNKEI